MTQKLSKAKISLINSLSMPKFRREHNLFVAEGHKIVSEIANSEFKIKYLVYNEDKEIPSESGDFDVFVCNDTEMKKISNYKTTTGVLAVVEMPQHQLEISTLTGKLSMAVEEIQDPGNLGTIIRICNWFGIENLICSKNSVDVFNPKVIQASMGAFLRVNLNYVELSDFITEYRIKTQHQVYGTFLEGENIYSANLPQAALIVLGNEGHGISDKIAELLDCGLYIPPFSNEGTHAESLNISSAAAIVCSEFRRRIVI
jgi:RNA methyltransferase, TrmH family